MAQFVNKLRDCVRTVNLTMLLVLNLFFIVTLNLTVATVLVVLEADHGFFIQDGSVSIVGALVILYASCILMAISLVVVNPSTKQVLLINTPRDYYVDTAASAGAKDKLTHCGMYGIDCSMATLGNLYDEHVDYYVQINFNGFKTLVDAVGGITVESEKAFRTSEGGFYINRGTNQLNGTVALSYVRERKSFADGENSSGIHSDGAKP